MLSSSSSSASRSRALLARQRQGLQNRQDVLLDRQLAEHRRLLRQIADALAGAHVHRIRGDVGAVELHAAAVGTDEADDGVEGRGLAGAVGAEQPDDFAGVHFERDAAENLAAAEAFAQVLGAQHAVPRVAAVVAHGVRSIAGAPGWRSALDGNRTALTRPLPPLTTLRSSIEVHRDLLAADLVGAVVQHRRCR